MNNLNVSHKVIIYHDETKDVPGSNLKGHVLLFVPIKLIAKSETPLFGSSVQEYFPQELFFEKLAKYRAEFACNGKLHFTEISGKTWKKYDYAYHKAIDVTVDALRHKSPIYFQWPLNFKVAAIFYPKGTDWNIYGGNTRKEQQFRHDETLLRILLKGAAHYLYDSVNIIEIDQIISDGYSAHRCLSEDRILRRLTYEDYNNRSPLRDYVVLTSNSSIMHLPSDHKQYQIDSREYIDANFLQIADLLLGSIIRTCFVGFQSKTKLPKIGEECIKKDAIAQPVYMMLDKKNRGGGFKNSGHYKSFTITQVKFDKAGVLYKEVQKLSASETATLQSQFIFGDQGS